MKASRATLTVRQAVVLIELTRHGLEHDTREWVVEALDEARNLLKGLVEDEEREVKDEQE